MNTMTAKTTIEPKSTDSTQESNDRRRTVAGKTWRFLLHFLEMQIPMGLGMIPWHVLVRELRASPTYTELFQPGSALSSIGHGLFMTIPMVVWMILRRHGWRHSIEMGVAMLAPGLAIVALCWLGIDNFWPWLITLASPAETLGMLVYMLYRRDHFTGKAGRPTHNGSPSAEPSCH